MYTEIVDYWYCIAAEKCTFQLIPDQRKLKWFLYLAHCPLVFSVCHCWSAGNAKNVKHEIFQ